MKTIHKYQIPVSNSFQLTLNEGYEVVRVGADPSGSPCFWAIVDDEKEETHEAFTYVGTGWKLPKGEFLGSWNDGPYVWHLFRCGSVEFKAKSPKVGVMIAPV